MICFECQLDAEVVARCAGSNCRAGICPLCYEPDGLCSECRAEEAKGIWCPPARDVALRLSGATIAGQRMPLCSASAEPADECRHMEADDA